MSRLLPALAARYRRGAVLLAGVPHRYAAEYPWPGSCWCGWPADAPVHRGQPAGGPR